MNLNQTPAAERPHIGFFGCRNAGKSSIVNAVTGQNLAVVSNVKGTTTDPVVKAMELLPAGPVVMIDTPGIDDDGELGKLRVEKETDCFCTERYREADHDSYDRRCSQERSIWYGRTVQPSFFPNTSSVWQYLLWLRNQG